MHIDWWTLGLQTVNLLVLLWILGRFLFRPMARIVAERQAAAVHLLEEAEAEKARAKAAADSVATERDAAAATRADLLEKAHAEAEAQRQALLEAAKQEALRARHDADAQIARLRAEEEVRVDRRANALATDIAARVLKEPAGRLPLTAFLAGFETALSSLPEASRAAICADGAPVTVSAARQPDADEQAACEAALARALGRAVSLSFSVDPDLLAGVALRTPTVAVDSNLRADLDHVLAGLNANATA
ncbi:MAG: F0F1 ATP synthase subunit delta [Rhodobiaceae bacterium]|nr:F0F1 ATP synthase subunit delta [Rhodobiaceae bacterium]